jgi:hypothetical protein
MTQRGPSSSTVRDRSAKHFERATSVSAWQAVRLAVRGCAEIFEAASVVKTRPSRPQVTNGYCSTAGCQSATSSCGSSKSLLPCIPRPQMFTNFRAYTSPCMRSKTCKPHGSTCRSRHPHHSWMTRRRRTAAAGFQSSVSTKSAGHPTTANSCELACTVSTAESRAERSLSGLALFRFCILVEISAATRPASALGGAATAPSSSRPTAKPAKACPQPCAAPLVTKTRKTRTRTRPRAPRARSRARWPSSSTTGHRNANAALPPLSWRKRTHRLLPNGKGRRCRRTPSVGCWRQSQTRTKHAPRPERPRRWSERYLDPPWCLVASY